MKIWMLFEYFMYINENMASMLKEGWIKLCV